MDGDGFVECAAGHRHWGRFGAAGLLLTDPERGVLLQHRAWWTHHGDTWALPGGARDSHEDAWQAATREAEEEAGIPGDAVRPLSAWTVDHGGWTYTTVLAQTVRPVREQVMNHESDELRWVRPQDVPGYPLHHDFASAWPSLVPQLGRELVLVVDGANVVGSRPDGWWRDRAGAAGRLRDRLATLVRSGVRGSAFEVTDGPEWSWWPRVVLVVEGQAKGVPASEEVEVVSAAQDGDSAIVDTVRSLRVSRPADHVTVVTADRELRSRITAEGAGYLGPGTLLAALDDQG
ncbi:NUDIX hydrolase [Amycolatopsis bartoniae]|uniref:NTP pyrophosphohydrolase n=1 Tax=Amycolatopsis bartoniae TaxID=941986 RepID=A0A8H9MDU9_9PSEU|nr:NUDIX hydrolase [Amycolatopsis bartoniae]TVT05965.1 NUDIX domain-containing protein [Amycolatopsis bartoniae]GHF82145.1 NTP pyrophosphohydrolase [Amycolatopsis bartoniae]